MFHLNERGWGLTIFLVFIGVFLIAIVLISIGAARIGLAPSKPTPQPTPIPTPSAYHYTQDEFNMAKQYEKDVWDASLRYFSDNYSGVNEKNAIVITSATLVDGHYLEYRSIAGNSCSGYSVVKKEEDTNQVSTYIQCGGVYTTSGYDASFES